MKIKIGICQLQVGEKKEENIQNAEKAVKKAVGQGAELVVLPEMFNCPYHSKYFPIFAETEADGETIMRLGRLAAELGCYLVGGSIPELDAGSIYNTSFIFNRQGKMIGKHRKVHLFDIDVPGQITFKESAVLSAGDRATVFQSDWGAFGVAICYDLRFPEFFRTMKRHSANVIFIPAAFNHITGPAHWEVLLRARAIDNQIFIVAAGPARNEAAEYKAYGHSMAVSPWGEILWSAGFDETVGVVELDLGLIDKVRRNMPLEIHRREDVYRR